MVKLIRLKGDSTKNNKEVRNIFSDSITLSKNSRIALRSCKVNFTSSINQEEFELSADNEYKYRVVGSSLQTVTVPAATYTSANALLRAMQIAANQTLSDAAITAAEYDGIHNVWTSSQDRAILNVYRAHEAGAGFSTQWVRGDDKDPNGVSLGLNAVESDGNNDYNLFLPQVVPLVSNTFTFTVETAKGTYDLGAIAYDDPTILYGVRYDRTEDRYRMLVNGQAVVDTGTAGQIGDVVSISKLGSKFNLTVVRAGAGAPIVNSTINITDVPDSENVLTTQNQFWSIDFKATGGVAYELTNCSCYALEKLNPNLTLNADAAVDVHVDFGTTDLAHFLGFPDGIYENQGQPATIRGERNIKGILTYSGIILNILGLDLDSYTGSQDSQPRNLNILDVLYPSNDSSVIEYVVNNPLKLNVKNSNPMVIRDLTMSFVRDDTNQQLEFIGNPVIVLEVYEEDEV